MVFAVLMGPSSRNEEINGAIANRRSINRIRRSANEMSDRTYERRGEMNVEEKAAVIDDAINSQSFYLLELHYSLDFTDSLNFDFDLAIMNFIIPIFRKFSLLFEKYKIFLNYNGFLT